MIFLMTMKMMVNEIMMVNEMVMVKEMMMVVRWTILFAGSSGLEAECRPAPVRFSQFTALQQQHTSVRMISFGFDIINTAEYNHIPSGIYERWERWEQRLSSVFHCPFDILGLLSQSQKHSNSGLICKRTNTYTPIACRAPKYPLIFLSWNWMNRMPGVIILRYCLTTWGGIALRSQVLWRSSLRSISCQLPSSWSTDANQVRNGKWHKVRCRAIEGKGVTTTTHLVSFKNHLISSVCNQINILTHILFILVLNS